MKLSRRSRRLEGVRENEEGRRKGGGKGEGGDEKEKRE